jgi:acetoin utilization deacetylase AcuC-like enzyme
MNQFSNVYISYAPVYVHAVPDYHRFPMEKYDLIYQQLRYEGLMEESEFIVPTPIDLKFVKAIHDQSYIDTLLDLKCTQREQRVSGFVHSKELIQRELTIMEGTRMLTEQVWKTKGCGLNIAGGTHHSYSNRGEGFCLLNDLAISAQYAIDFLGVKRVLILDLDVHQGNGTARIFMNDSRVFTFSMHGKNNYPLQKEKSDLDIELLDGTLGNSYLDLLHQNLTRVLETFNPDIVFYQCGVDVLDSDKLGKLSLTLEDCKNRDKFVFQTLKKRNLPVICTMGGGYSESVRIIVEAHMNTFRSAFDLF